MTIWELSIIKNVGNFGLKSNGKVCFRSVRPGYLGPPKGPLGSKLESHEEVVKSYLNLSQPKYH